MTTQDSPLTDALATAVARITADAAVAAFALAGRGDEKAADQAAVDAMRTGLNRLPMRGRIVIGEGERDEAPMLYIGEEVGTGEGPEIDIALDPLEGTTLTAKAMANALTVLALAPRGGLLFAPDTYMDKIAVGPGLPPGIVDLDADAGDNVRAIARARGIDPGEVTVCVLDRPRHSRIIEGVRAAGARVSLISDGDVAGVIATTDPATGIDLYIGQGGAPEGVLASAALRCVGGQFQGRLVFRNDDEKARATRIGVTDFSRRYSLEELVSTHAIFAASGVTGGSLLGGVRRTAGMVHTHTLVWNSATGRRDDIRTSQAQS
jgi:fructose-1,6-bisphosphatase II / sedoheptulose-1,7-bisphosphatase